MSTVLSKPKYTIILRLPKRLVLNGKDEETIEIFSDDSLNLSWTEFLKLKLSKYIDLYGINSSRYAIQDNRPRLLRTTWKLSDSVHSFVHSFQRKTKTSTGKIVELYQTESIVPPIKKREIMEFYENVSLGSSVQLATVEVATYDRESRSRLLRNPVAFWLDIYEFSENIFQTEGEFQANQGTFSSESINLNNPSGNRQENMVNISHMNFRTSNGGNAHSSHFQPQAFTVRPTYPENRTTYLKYIVPNLELSRLPRPGNPHAKFVDTVYKNAANTTPSAGAGRSNSSGISQSSSINLNNQSETITGRRTDSPIHPQGLDTMHLPKAATAREETRP